MVTTPEIAEVLTRRCYFNTFGGNPVCTAAGLAVLKVIEKEKLQENAHVVGSYLKDRLLNLKDKHQRKKLSLLASCYGSVWFWRMAPSFTFQYPSHKKRALHAIFLQNFSDNSTNFRIFITNHFF